MGWSNSPHFFKLHAMAKGKQPKERLEKRFIVEDKHQNKIVTEHYASSVKIFLQLKSEDKSRLVGTIDRASDTLKIRRDRSKHLFLKNRSYGFNHIILKNAKLFNKVHISDKESKWLVTKDYILEKGEFLHFINNGGFELQIFVKLSVLSEGNLLDK
jgi:hypothetical protein